MYRLVLLAGLLMLIRISSFGCSMDIDPVALVGEVGTGTEEWLSPWPAG